MRGGTGLINEDDVLDKQQVSGRRLRESANLGGPGITQVQQLGPGRRREP